MMITEQSKNRPQSQHSVHARRKSGSPRKSTPRRLIAGCETRDSIGMSLGAANLCQTCPSPQPQLPGELKKRGGHQKQSQAEQSPVESLWKQIAQSLDT